MQELTPQDVKNWDLQAIDLVFKTSQSRAANLRRFGEDLGDVRDTLGGWHGEGGDAFRADIGKICRDAEYDEQESRRAAQAVSNAKGNIQLVQSQLSQIETAVQSHGWSIDPAWRVVGDGVVTPEDMTAMTDLQAGLNQVRVAAHTADHELATALRSAVIDGPQLDDNGHVVDPPARAPHDAGGEQRPGATDVNDTDIPGPPWQDGFNPDQWKNSWRNPMLADNPPGYTGERGPARDLAWQNYLAHFPADGRGFLPNPDAVDDRGLQMLGNAANQLGTSYAWGGSSTSGPAPGTLKNDEGGGAHRYHDDQRIGFDCSGLARYAAALTTGTDIGNYTGSQLDSPNLAGVPGSAPLKPGDLIYYGPGTAGHVGIYVAPGVILNAPESGLPVQLDHNTTVPNGMNVRVRRLP